MVRLNSFPSSSYSYCTALCVCFLWAAIGCAGIFFNAYDYPSWVATVMVFRNTTILTNSGWLQLNSYSNATVGRALYRTAFQMQNSTNGSLSSFNTSFVFSIDRIQQSDYYGDGFAFLLCPIPFRSDQVSSGGYLGMFNSGNIGMLGNKVFAVEFDTHRNTPYRDPNDNHIGVDLNSVISLTTNNLTTLGFVLNGGQEIVCWVDYDGLRRHLWVYLALSPSAKPSSPAMSMALDLAPYVNDYMYVGFSSATGSRAEVHTIHSWWFLAGFGNLTFPSGTGNLTLPSGTGNHSSTSARPLAELAHRQVAMVVILLAALVVFLCLFSICACSWWRERSKHLIDILLPVACWIYWKESIPFEMRSTRCLKLATPVVELLAWLWRTRSVRKLEEVHAITWWEVQLKGKVGPYHKAMPSHLENTGWKGQNQLGFHRRGSFLIPQRAPVVGEELVETKKDAKHGVVYTSINCSSQESVFTHTDATNLTGSASSAKKDMARMQNSAVDNTGIDHTEGEIDVTSSHDRSSHKFSSWLTSKTEKAHLYCRPSITYVTKDDPHSYKFKRRGSFLVHSGDAVRLMDSSSDFEAVNTLPECDAIEHDSDLNSIRVYGLRRGSFMLPRTEQEFELRNGPFMQYAIERHSDSTANRVYGLEMESFTLPSVEHDIGTMDGSPMQCTIEEGNNDLNIRSVHRLRGKSLKLPRIRHEFETGNEPSVQNVSESEGNPYFTKLYVPRRGAFMVPRVEHDIGTVNEPLVQFTNECGSHTDSTTVHGLGRGSVMLPRVEHDIGTVNEPSVKYSFECDSDPNCGRVYGLRRGPFMLPRVEHGVATTSTEEHIRRGSFILVNEANASYKPRLKDQTSGSVPHKLISGIEHEHKGDVVCRLDVRRGSFILVEAGASLPQPEAREHAEPSGCTAEDGGLQESSSDYSKPS